MLNPTVSEVEFGNYATFIAATESDEINVLATLEYADIFGTQNMFRIEPSDKFKMISESYYQGRLLFNKGATSTYFSTRLIAGASYVTEKVSDENTIDIINEKYRNCIKLFIILPNLKVHVFNQIDERSLENGDRVVLLVS